jgi:small subunit ribosomal protein S1
VAIGPKYQGPPPGGYRGGPPRPGQPGEPRGRDRFPRGDRPKVDGSKPQDLAPRDFFAAKPNARDLDQSIEAELNAALAGFDVTGTVATEEAKPRTPGAAPAKKKGVVVGVHGKDVFVEVPGGRSQGVLPLMQFENRTPQVGETVEFDIEGYDGANGLLRLTMTGATVAVANWSSVTRGMVVEAKVTGANQNKTGLHVEVNGIKGFLPAGQVDLYRTENIEALIGQKLKCEVIELDPAERNLVVSRKILLEREKMVLAEQFWKTVEQGQVRTGIVRSVKPFGAFVDLGGADGLIPVSEMSWSRIGDPSEVVKIGQKVEVLVNRLDPDTRKIGLSLRALVRSPWSDFADAHKPGARVAGKVTRLMDFGAFVEVAPGIEGLVHVSELSTQRVRRASDVVKAGDVVDVQIQSIDVAARRMSLSLKAIKEAHEIAEWEKEAEEEEAARKEAEERMENRPINPNLRGGIGSRG